jgi:hypothetical protein
MSQRRGEYFPDIQINSLALRSVLSVFSKSTNQPRHPVYVMS